MKWCGHRSFRFEGDHYQCKVCEAVLRCCEILGCRKIATSEVASVDAETGDRSTELVCDDHADLLLNRVHLPDNMEWVDMTHLLDDPMRDEE